MRDFRRLQVWNKAHQLTLAIYEATVLFPRDEMYGLTSQMRRSSASIPANIAEGCGRPGSSEFGRFLGIAMGSASELEYHLILAQDLCLLPSDRFETLSHDLIEVKRMLVTLAQKLRIDSQ